MEVARLLLLAGLIGIASAYYVPGTYPQEFNVGDQLQGAGADSRERPGQRRYGGD